MWKKSKRTTLLNPDSSVFNPFSMVKLNGNCSICEEISAPVYRKPVYRSDLMKHTSYSLFVWFPNMWKVLSLSTAQVSGSLFIINGENHWVNITKAGDVALLLTK